MQWDSAAGIALSSHLYLILIRRICSSTSWNFNSPTEVDIMYWLLQKLHNLFNTKRDENIFLFHVDLYLIPEII
jgi:hypothetical protein